MLKSMTAFGRAEAETDGKKITVELRSVNSRYFECSVRMPRALGFGDDKVKSYLSSNGISRGKVDVNISVERTEPLPVKVGIDRAYADGYVAALRELSELYGLPNDISTMRVASNRDIFTFEKEAEDATKDWDTVSPVIDSALAAFLAARSEEGERLCADLDIKIEGVKALVDKIEVLSVADIAAARERIEARLKKMLGDLEITADENRILTECAIYSDKIAIDEELVRLRSHFAAYEKIVSSGEPAGRKLDFLMQEMNREINTIGSKCQNSATAHIVVDVKCEFEKIREQIQNIE
ncbi:MAG: YicC family protein [Ruminococcaceae bacterium]|nr:YicC family protein [Oscillospiraceae bacterium]